MVVLVLRRFSLLARGGSACRVFPCPDMAAATCTLPDCCCASAARSAMTTASHVSLKGGEAADGWKQ